MVNKQNYHWVKTFLHYLEDVMQTDKRTTSRYWFYLRHLLLWANESLVTDAPHIRPTFPAYLVAPGVDPMAPATLKKIIQVSQRFFRWGKAQNPRQFNPLPETWIDALKPPRVVQLPAEHVFVIQDEVQRLGSVELPADDLALRRDQAGAVLLFLSGMRAGALGSLPISAVDMTHRTIRQWPALKVHTKNGKSATTYLLPIPELLAVVERWDEFIRARLPDTAMWYTPINGSWGIHKLLEGAAGSNRNVAVGRRLRKLFAAADLPFKSAHKFRHGHAVWALQHAQTMADYKAVSMNLMHSDIRITDSIYAPLLGSEVRDRIGRLADQANVPANKGAELVPNGNELSKAQLAAALRSLADQVAS